MNQPAAEQAAQWLQKGVTLHQQGKLSEAEPCYNQALTLVPNHPDALHLLGLMAYQVQKTELAIDLIGKAIAIHATQPAYHNHLGQAYMQAGKPQQAIPAYQEALALKPDFAEAQVNLANAHQALGDTDAALSAYDAALATNPNLPQAHYNKGVMLAALNRLEEAEACYRTAIKHKTNYGEAWGNLGNVLRSQGRLDEARETYRHATTLQPDNARNYINLGTVLRELGNLDEASRVYQQAISLTPDSGEAHNNLGNVYKAQGKMDEAVTAYQQGITCLMDAKTPPQPRAKAYMDIETAHTALQALKQALDAEHIPFFLAYGTLLGIVRDGDLLPHDKDMDIGLPWDTDRQKLTRSLVDKYGFSPIYVGCDAEESAQWSLTFVHRATGIEIDCFFFKPDGNMLLSGLHHRPVPLLWRFSAFETEELDYLETTWRIPSPPERYLEEIYGEDWRVPNAHFDSLISGCNREERAFPVARCFGYNRLFERINRAEWTKAEGYCRQLLAKSDDPFIERVTHWLKEQHSA